MTNFEKEIIAAALTEYACKHQKMADRAASRKDINEAKEQHLLASEAMTILTFWREVMEAPCGSVKI